MGENSSVPQVLQSPLYARVRDLLSIFLRNFNCGKRAPTMAFSFSADRVYNLYLNFPHWRFYLLARWLSIVISLVILALATTLLERNASSEPRLEWSYLVLVSRRGLSCQGKEGVDINFQATLSTLWAMYTSLTLMITTKRLPPAADITLDLIIGLWHLTAFVLSVILYPYQSHFSDQLSANWQMGIMGCLAMLL